MKNFVQEGNTVTLTAPTGGIKGGEPMQAGSLFGVACGDAAEGAPVEVMLVGVFDLPSTGAIDQGALAYWDGAANRISAAGTLVVGAVTEAVGSGGTVARVRLNGVAVV